MNATHCARMLLLSLLVSSAMPWAAQQAEDRARQLAAEELAYRDAISTIESRHGVYSGHLPENVLSLGYTLQNQGRHEEAVDLFKRGVHVSRINDGLYGQQQLPLLQGQIASHIALGQYVEADERQGYMYRVQIRSLKQGQLRADALMQQAQWQYNAYQLELGSAGFTRLMNMWDLYRMALNDIIDKEGDNSTQLLPPLQGMLRAQYLIADYQPNNDYGDADDLRGREKLTRFNAYRSQSYDRGSSIILAMYNIEQTREGQSQQSSGLSSAEALVMLGDWRWWNDEREDALQAYRKALAELVVRDDAQLQIDRLFGEPVALPNVDGVRALSEVEDREQGDILVEFGVTKRGRVVNLERLEKNEDANKALVNRSMRQLRKTRFRPRFEIGEPVDTEKIVKAYEID